MHERGLPGEQLLLRELFAELLELLRFDLLGNEVDAGVSVTRICCQSSITAVRRYWDLSRFWAIYSCFRI